MRLRRLLRELGSDPGPVATPEEALARLGPGPDRMPPEKGEWPRYLVGAPEQVHAALVGVATALGVEELMVLTVVHEHEARLRSYRLLAEIFGLTPRAQHPGGRRS